MRIVVLTDNMLLAIAGAAGFAAMKAYESHLRASGQQPSHMLMKVRSPFSAHSKHDIHAFYDTQEILAGIAAAEVDKLVETKGMDWIDRHKAHKQAQKQAHDLAEQRYRGGTGWEYAMSQGGPTHHYDYEARAPWGAQGHVAYGMYGYPQQGYPQQGYGQPEYTQVVYENYEEHRHHDHHHGHHDHHHHH